jgi:hypothetical protein
MSNQEKVTEYGKFVYDISSMWALQEGFDMSFNPDTEVSLHGVALKA